MWTSRSQRCRGCLSGDVSRAGTARSIARRPQLANWLYGVAVRSAKDVKGGAARNAHSRRGIVKCGAQPAPTATKSIHFYPSSTSRSTSCQRSSEPPIVLCDPEGKSHTEAAHLLSVPLGTIASRLSRGRDRLRQRLLRRGCSGSPAMIAATLSRDNGLISPALVASTANLAVCIVTGGATTAGVPALLISLTDGVNVDPCYSQNSRPRPRFCALAWSFRPAGRQPLAVVGGFRESKNLVVDGQTRGSDASIAKETDWIDGFSQCRRAHQKAAEAVRDIRPVELRGAGPRNFLIRLPPRSGTSRPERGPSFDLGEELPGHGVLARRIGAL